jgi:putative DNA primase/helicase
MKQFLDFFTEALTDDAIIAITSLSSSKKPKHDFFTKNNILTFKADIENYDIYIRATALSAIPKSGRGKKTDTLGSLFVWADIDYYKIAGCSMEDAITAIENLPLLASCIVYSGHGLQLWWKLDKFNTDVELIEQVNGNIASTLKSIGADSTVDVARLLRLPGTINHKHEAATKCIVRSMSNVTYSIEALNKAFTAAEKVVVKIQAEQIADDFEDRLPKALWQRIYSEDTAKAAGAIIREDGEIDSSRNDAVIATKLLQLGYSAGIVVAVLSNKNWFCGKRCQAKGGEQYVQRTVQSALKFVQQQSNEFFDKQKFLAVKLASHIVNKFNIFTIGSVAYIYNDGVYKVDQNHTIEKYIEDALKELWKPIHQQSVIKWIADQTAIASNGMIRYNDLLNVKNGMLNIYDKSLVAHSANYNSFVQIAANYDASATSNKVKQFIADLIPADAIDTFWQFMAFCLLNDYRFKKALLLIGAGDTGKSALLSLIRRFFGRENCASVSIQDLTSDKFAKAELFGKMLNIYADLSLSAIELTGQFKSLTGDDEILVQHKYSQPFSFVNQAKLIFSANDFASVSKPDATFFDRFIVIAFNHRFIAGKTAIANIAATFTDHDLSAFLNYALDALDTLLTAGNFTIGDSSIAMKQEFLEVSDNIVAFIYAATEIDENAEVSKADMYSAYKNWCFRTHHSAVSSIRFFRRIKDSIDYFNLTEHHITRTDKQTWIYKGRSLLDRATIDHNGIVHLTQAV